MTSTALLKRALALGAGLLIVLLVVGQLLGQPILLGYVATGSMEPTMDAGDGFVAIPSVVSGDVGEGDIIVFEARELHDGELTTHRVVEETDEGYVTRGDANPFTDQDGGEPHVSESQIVATAWQVNGNAVTIPYLGTAIMGVQSVVESAIGTVGSVVGVASAPDSEGLGAMLVGVGVAILGFGVVLDQLGPGQRETSRSRSRTNVIAFWTALGLILLVFVTFATAAMVVPAGTAEYGLVSTDSPSDDPQVLAPGETGELTQAVDNAGYLPIVAVHEADRGAAVEPESQTVGLRSSGETTVSLTAPEETGEYTRDVREYRYLMVLPPTVLVWLHGLHPLAAIAAVNGVIVGATVALVLLVFGYNDIRVRSAGDHVPLSTRLERKFKKWL
ncbi:signal peptidase I [Natronolimnohabitans innermongolicus]|uniref:Peptidase S26B, signal peptidase n=1 Tax=Natronolimnohabitans innermongolicus JCM 12255 TaxID=1227499 RepID=L9WX37_9EURY|nr:signal peptidase I [Natronolimnohabitans innermongolicus]ELY54005.1 peptidase S26B, signal peptidase [Natronolimnohabitans innermongolicus JCM 12255]